MDSAQITLSSVTASDQILLEAATGGFVALDATNEFGKDEGDYILSEQTSVGEFTKGETITGGTSKQTSVILAEDTDNLKLYIDANSKFITGETITGSSSNSTGTIASYKPNPVTNIQQLLNMSNVDATIFQFLDNFRDAFLEGIVDNLATGVNKRSLIKNIRDLYIKKGTKRGHELFFRLLLNEEPTISFPNEQMIRLSDGNWTRKKIMRVLSNSGNPSELVGQVITGQTTTSTAIPVSVVTFRESGTTVYAIEIDEDTADDEGDDDHVRQVGHDAADGRQQGEEAQAADTEVGGNAGRLPLGVVAFQIELVGDEDTHRRGGNKRGHRVHRRLARQAIKRAHQGLHQGADKFQEAELGQKQHKQAGDGHGKKDAAPQVQRQPTDILVQQPVGTDLEHQQEGEHRRQQEGQPGHRAVLLMVGGDGSAPWSRRPRGSHQA